MKNGNGHYPKKAESQQLSLTFWTSQETARGASRAECTHAYLFGDPGKQLKVILLDEYYNADEPGPESDLLGEEQWQWLGGDLKSAQGDVVVLGSSIQLLPSEHPYDHWGNYPKARKRMLQLLADSRPKMTVILSGDRHLGEISRADDSGLPYPLYEITSSGLTHHVDFVYHLRSFVSPETNRYRVGDLFYEKNFGLVEIDWSGGSPVLSLQIRDQ